MQRLSITWLGHSTFIVRTPGGKRLLFDPWLSSNPSCPESMKKPPKVDLILASHGHFDHIEDLVACARETDAPGHVPAADRHAGAAQDPRRAARRSGAGAEAWRD